MDPNRFDDLTRRSAMATTRRAAIRGLAGGGLLAALGVKGASSSKVGAAAASTCTWSWTGNVRLGPDTGVMLASGASQPGELKGTLSLPIGDDGAIDQGQLVLADGTTMAVVGQAVGRAVNLRLQGNNGNILIAVGTGEQAIGSCAGRIDGPLTGPQLGDLGEWHAVANGASGGNGGSGGTTVVSGGAAPGANPTATAAPTAGANNGAGGGDANCASGVVCNGVCCEPAPGLTPDSITCNAGFCECSYSCAAAGCNGGTGTIVNTCGSDPQPHCHSECNVPDDNGCGDMTCPDGQTLDVDTCTCQQAEGGADACDGADLLHDANNCGFCGVVCGSGFCQNGVCTDSDPCVQTSLTNCNSQCVDTQSDPENCGGCGNHCPSGQCIQGNCTEVIH